MPLYCLTQSVADKSKMRRRRSTRVISMMSRFFCRQFHFAFTAAVAVDLQHRGRLDLGSSQSNSAADEASADMKYDRFAKCTVFRWQFLLYSIFICFENVLHQCVATRIRSASVPAVISLEKWENVKLKPRANQCTKRFLWFSKRLFSTEAIQWRVLTLIFQFESWQRHLAQSPVDPEIINEDLKIWWMQADKN